MKSNLLTVWQDRFFEMLQEKTRQVIAEKGMIEKKDLNILPECSNCHLVFVDGHLDLLLSSIPDGLIAMPLEASFSSYGLFLQNRWTKMLQEEKEEKLFMNASHVKNALFLYVPPEFSCDAPLQVHHVFTAQNIAVSRVEAILGKNSHLKIVETYQTLTDSPVHNNAWIITLEQNASADFLNQSFLSFHSCQDHFVRSFLKEGASFSFLQTSRGAKTSCQSVQVELVQENSSAHIKALCMLDDARSANYQILMRHSAPNTTSRQHVKTALLDESRSKFEGKIYVTKEAQKTESYQLNQNLILSENARAESKPGLEIFADDVKASHGAVVSQLSEEELFYLQSRGINEQRAKQLLVYGFCKELIEEVQVTSCRDQILEEMQKWIS